MLLLLYLKRFLSSPRSQRFTPVVSYKNFIVLTFTFRSFLFYILRSFLLKVWGVLNSPLCMWIPSCFSTFNWKNPFYILLPWRFCRKLVDHASKGFFSGLLILFYWSIFPLGYPHVSTRLSGCSYHCNKFWNQECKSSDFVFLFLTLFWPFWVLWISI